MNSTNDFKSKLLQEDMYDLNAERYVEKIKNINSIVIWGSCSTGQLMYNFLEKFGISEKVKYFADNNKEKWQTKMNKLLVLSPDEVVKKTKENSNTYIIIAALHLSDIKKQLLSLGIEERVIDVKGFYLARNYWIFKKTTPFTIIHSNIDKYEQVYSYLSDERSKVTYLGILNSKISLNNKYLLGISNPSDDQYFDKEFIKINQNEIFCDCGSYNGDTLEKFVSLSNGKYEKYIAIEADNVIYAELNKKVTNSKYKNIQTYNVACWNEKAILKFQSAESAGHVTEFGDISVQADTLNNILENEKVTYLKMDIEGAEEMALKGASGIIHKNEPILGICIYHSLEDYYKLPLIMKDLHRDYKLFIRNYTDMFDVETVCYAIPEERLFCKNS